MKPLAFLIIILVLVVVLKLTSFGWRFFKPQSSPATQGTKELKERLKDHVVTLSDRIGDRSVFRYEQLQEAAGYISDQLRSIGYELIFQEYTVYNKRVANIIATKKGSHRADEVIVVGAHYDTCANPGADDNASAVAGLIELARHMYNKDTSRTIEFIAFVNEEPPFFKSAEMGSLMYAREARRKKKNIKAALILEMIGSYCDEPHSQKYPPLFGAFYPNRANFICVVSSFSYRSLVKKITTAFKEHTSFPVESFIGPAAVTGVDFSDHWSFWQEGYAAVMITDTSFYRYPYYHSQEDTYEKLDYTRMSQVVEGFGHVVEELAR